MKGLPALDGPGEISEVCPVADLKKSQSGRAVLVAVMESLRLTRKFFLYALHSTWTECAG